MKVNWKVVIFIIGVISLGLYYIYIYPQAKLIHKPEITQSPITTDLPTTDLPVTDLPATDSQEVENPPHPPACVSQYPPVQVGWNSGYFVQSTISVEDLYIQEYGAKHNNYDLYAIVYYNNRKSLETNLYDPIDPIKLNIESGWTIFLPPPSWINIYRDFPIPIPEIKNLAKAGSTISISGSSVLFPLSLQMARCFTEANKSYDIVVESNSTESGLYDYCQGDVSMFGTSDEITQDMIDKSGCEGVNLLKFEVARQAIAIFINKNNPNISDIREKPLSREELKKLLISATLWSNVRNYWADDPINRYYPPKDSGTFEIVKNELFSNESIDPDMQNPQEIDNDNLLASKVADDTFALGFSGYAYYQPYKDSLIVLPIDNSAPNTETIKGNNPSYPLARSLYLYTGETTYNENSLLRYFIDYYLAYEFDFIDELGYFQPNNNDLLNNPNTIP